MNAACAWRDLRNSRIERVPRPMELIDSRRLTGPNVLWSRAGAVIDVRLDGEDPTAFVASWREEVRRKLNAVGWRQEDACVRAFDGGVSLAISAPLDALYAATEVNESAFQAALAIHGGPPAPDAEAEIARLLTEIAQESKPALIALQREAAAHRVAFLSDDDHVSIGLGRGSMTWAVTELPDLAAVNWSELHDIPTAMVTGTNGKTTTIRMLASIVRAAGRVPGISSTDCIQVGEDQIEQGDWSGPGGARLVLRDRRTEVALLETARGGMMRRGLALESCDVGAILNVAADHLGEWGVDSVEALAEGKFILARIARVMVLNADDEVLAARAPRLAQEVFWFGLDARSPRVAAHVAEGGRACVLDDGVLKYHNAGREQRLLEVKHVPATLGGAARFNTANALAAACVALALGIELDDVCTGLRLFECDPRINPGRLNRFDLGGVHAIVDFAHNPHGVEATLEAIRALPSERVLILLGQSGDRDEASTRDMVRLAWSARPEMIVIKEMTEHLRGRPLGELPALIERELRAAGVPEERFVHCSSELAAVRWALEWSRPGDLLLLLTHDKRDEVLALMHRLTESDWKAGTPLPNA